jgi:hypothetical protein
MDFEEAFVGFSFFGNDFGVRLWAFFFSRGCGRLCGWRRRFFLFVLAKLS